MNWLDLDAPADRLLGRCLRRQAEDQPDAAFLLSDEASFTYGEANEAVNARAAGFAERGIGRGDTVAFLLESSVEYVLCALALNKLGAIWVPTNLDYKGVWLREALEESRASLLVAEGELLPRLAELGELPFERMLVRGEGDAPAGVTAEPLEALAAQPGPEPDDADLHYGDTAAVLFTSGTTGRSKGVMQSHNVWIQAAQNGARTSDLREGDVIYSCLPMYQSAAWVANVFRALVTGVPCAIDARFSATDFWDRCRHFDATMVFTLGAMHIFLWQAPEKDDDADNPVRVASMIPMPAELEEPFKKRFGIEQISQGYGQSEAFTLFARTRGRTWKPNCLGEVQEGVEIRLLDDEDREVPRARSARSASAPWSPTPSSTATSRIPRRRSRPSATSGTTPATWPGGTRTATGSSWTARPTTSASRGGTSRPSRWRPR